VSAITLTPALARQLGLDVQAGALRANVEDRSPANAAGLRGGGADSGGQTGAGDVIVRVGDRDIASADDLANAISDLPAGDTFPVEYARDGNRAMATVRLPPRPGPDAQRSCG